MGELGDADDHMNAGDHNRNIKALPATDVTDYSGKHHLTGTSHNTSDDLSPGNSSTGSTTRGTGASNGVIYVEEQPTPEKQAPLFSDDEEDDPDYLASHAHPHPRKRMTTRSMRSEPVRSRLFF